MVSECTNFHFANILVLWEIITDGVREVTELEGQLANFNKTYVPGGHSPAKGEIFRNPDLANFFERLANEGRDYFYKGAAGAAIAAVAGKRGAEV